DAQAVLPNDYTFVPGDNGSHAFSITLKTAGTQFVTVTDTVNSAFAGSLTGINVTAAGASTFLLTFPTNVVAGNAGTFTVTARDAFGNVATSYRGTVHFSSSDGQAALPADYAFTGTDLGSHSFSATL